MNWRRVGHLLAYELKRIKGLIVFAWVGLALVIVAPTLRDSMPWLWPEWHENWKFLYGLGFVIFGTAGLFLSIWSGLMERKLFPARPVLKRELRLVSWGVLLVVLVLPILAWAMVSLWMEGYSGRMVWEGALSTGLMLVPFWMGYHLFAKYAGSFKGTVVGLAILFGLVALLDSFRIRGIAEPWVNVFGYWQGPGHWMALLIPVVVMAGLWGVMRRRGGIARMAVAVLSVVMGWGAMHGIKVRQRKTTFEREFSNPPVIGSESLTWKADAYLDYYDPKPVAGEVMIWEVENSFKDGEGRSYRSGKAEMPEQALHWIGHTAMSRIAKDLVGEEVSFLGERRILEEQFFLNLPGGKNSFEEVRLSGRLLGKRCAVEEVFIDLPFGEDLVFQREELTGRAIWKEKRTWRGEKGLELVIREPFSMERFDEVPGGEVFDNWLVFAKYPKAGVAVEGEQRVASSPKVTIGGVKQWKSFYTFRHSDLRKFKVGDEVPLISVYRVKVLGSGFAKVETEPLVWKGNDSGKMQSAYHSLLYGARRDVPMMSTASWKVKADPLTANRQEVGAWFRELDNHYGRSWERQIFAQYADGWADLFFEAEKKSGRSSWARMSGFANGASEEAAKLAVDELGGEVSHPWLLVERGWEEMAREKVQELIAGGNRDPEILRLGIFLGLEGIEEAVLEGLLESDSWSLYEAARVKMRLGDRIREILDQRLEQVDKLTKREWMTRRHDYYFRSAPWLWLLHEGRKSDLERCLVWLRKAHEAGNYGFHELDHKQPVKFERLLFGYKQFEKLGNFGKLKAEFFEWDPVMRKWVFNEEGEAK